jgi:hypothetical protein
MKGNPLIIMPLKAARLLSISSDNVAGNRDSKRKESRR